MHLTPGCFLPLNIFCSSQSAGIVPMGNSSPVQWRSAHLEADSVELSSIFSNSTHLAVSFSYTEILTQPPGCVAEHLPFFCQDPLSSWASLMAQLVKNLSAMQDTQDQFLGWEDRRDRLPTPVFLDFPCDSAGKESACNAGDLGSIPGLGRSPGEGKGYPLQCSGLKNSMSPWGGNESDTTFIFTFFPLR